MSDESMTLYCAIDYGRTVIKIGVSKEPYARMFALRNTIKKKMELFCFIEFEKIHFESYGYLQNGSKYDTPTSYNLNHSTDSLGVDIPAKVFALENFFKKRFKDDTIQGKEWFNYSENNLSYVKRLFNAMAKSENTALIRTRLISGF